MVTETKPVVLDNRIREKFASATALWASILLTPTSTQDCN